MASHEARAGSGGAVHAHPQPRQAARAQAFSLHDDSALSANTGADDSGDADADAEASFLTSASSSPPPRPPTAVPSRASDKTPRPGDWGRRARPGSASGGGGNGGDGDAAEGSTGAGTSASGAANGILPQSGSLFGWVRSAFGGLAPSSPAGAAQSGSGSSTPGAGAGGAGAGSADARPDSPAGAAAAADNLRAPRGMRWRRTGSDQAAAALAGGKAAAAGARGSGASASGLAVAAAGNGSAAAAGAAGVGAGAGGELSEARSSYRVSHKVKRRASARGALLAGGLGLGAASGAAAAAAGQQPKSARSSLSRRSESASSSSGEGRGSGFEGESDDGDAADRSYDDEDDDDEDASGAYYSDGDEDYGGGDGYGYGSGGSDDDADSVATEDELYVPFAASAVPPPLVRPAARSAAAAGAAPLALAPDSPTEELGAQAAFASLHIDPSAQAQAFASPGSVGGSPIKASAALPALGGASGSSGTGSGFLSASGGGIGAGASAHDLRLSDATRLLESTHGGGAPVVQDTSGGAGSGAGAGAQPALVLTPPGSAVAPSHPAAAAAAASPVDRSAEATPVPGLMQRATPAGAAGMARAAKEEVVLGSRTAGAGHRPPDIQTHVPAVHIWSEEDRAKTPLASAGRSAMAAAQQQQPALLSPNSKDKKARRAERKFLSEASGAPDARPPLSALSSASSASSSTSASASGSDAGSAPSASSGRRGFFGRSREASAGDAGASGKLGRSSSLRVATPPDGASASSGSGSGSRKSSWLFGGSRHKRAGSSNTSAVSASTAASDAGSSGPATGSSSDVASIGSGSGSGSGFAPPPPGKEKKAKGSKKDKKSAAAQYAESASDTSLSSASRAPTDDGDARSLHSASGQSSIGASAGKGAKGRGSVSGSVKSDSSKAPASSSPAGPKKLKIRYKNKSSKDRHFDKVFLAQELHVGSSSYGGGLHDGFGSRSSLSINRQESWASGAPSSAASSAASSPARPIMPHLHSSSSLASYDGAILAGKRPRPVSVHSTAPSIASSTASRPKKGKAIWAMRWSPCGRYLAVAGQDCVITVYEVLSTKEARQHEIEQARMHAFFRADPSGSASARGTGSISSQKKGKSGGSAASTPAAMPDVMLNPKEQLPVFKSTPVRELRGHSQDILDISWSKNNFLLSCSMDKTAKLWHVSRDECLCTFAHLDFVTAACFHPKDDRFFISGSLDGKLRLWNIPAKKVQASQEVPGLITACTFTQSGATACVGTFSGAALFYDTERLTYTTSIAVRSSTNKNARGRKITGIEPIWTPDGSEKVLITSNDSRIRVYDIKMKRLARKFKGNTYLNRTSQIRATVSDDGNFVISGSEDAHVYVWDAGAGPASLLSLDTLQGKGKNPDAPYEYWTAHPGTVTGALVAPLKVHGLLEKSEDPIQIHAQMHQAGRVSTSTTSTLTAMSLASAFSAAMPANLRPGGVTMAEPGFDAKRNRIICTVDETMTLRVWRADSYDVLKNMAPIFATPPGDGFPVA